MKPFLLLACVAAAFGVAAQPAPQPTNAAGSEALEEFKGRAASAKVLTFRTTSDLPRPAALVVALHGLGGTAERFAPVWQKVADHAGAILVVPEGIERFGDGFSWGRVEECEILVLAAIRKVRSGNAIDPRQIVLTGFSQGGTMTFHLALRHPDVFAGAIPVAGFYDERLTPVPVKPKRLPRFAILNGEKDRHPENNRVVAKLLKEAKTPVLLRIYPGLGHELPPRYPQELWEALRFVLGR